MARNCQLKERPSVRRCVCRVNFELSWMSYGLIARDSGPALLLPWLNRDANEGLVIIAFDAFHSRHLFDEGWGDVFG